MGTYNLWWSSFSNVVLPNLWVTKLVSIILLFIAGAAKGFCDSGAFHNKPQSFNPANTWQNKYKNGDEKQGEKFFLSTSILVFLTDWWHFADFVRIITPIMAIVFYTPLLGLWDVLILYLAFTLGFHLIYNWVYG